MDNEETAKGAYEQPGDTGAEEPLYTAGSAKQKEPFWRRRVGPGLIVLIILGVVILRGWFIEGVIVGGNSMAPTLRSGQRLLVWKRAYNAEETPERGAVVTFREPTTDSIAVKRVIAKPGERLVIYGTQVYIDGQELVEPYARGHIPRLIQGVVPEETVWLMGDNRDNSTDSRSYGPVELSAIRGRAVLVIWPLPPKTIPEAQPALNEQ